MIKLKENKKSKELIEIDIKTDGRSSHVRILLSVLLIASIILIILLIRNLKPWNEPPPFYIVEWNEFHVALESAEHPVIIDIRGVKDYSNGHIPNAQVGESSTCLEFGVPLCTIEKCDHPRTYFFYSHKGEDYHEVRNAIIKTSDRGCWDEVYMLEGGFNDWRDAGLDIEIFK